MKRQKPFFIFAQFERSILAFILLSLPPVASAQIIWNGPNTNYTESPVATLTSPNGGGADLIIGPTGTNTGVSLARSYRDILYNRLAGETAANDLVSPKDCMWAFGALANATNLTYQTMGAIRASASFDLAAALTNKPMVLHLTNENIYLSIKFITWPQHDAGGFSYVRSTAPTAASPTVSITNPISGSVFAAPANVTLSANATVSSGTVTNVKFFQGATALGSVTSAPFNFTVSGLAAGSYSFTAVATAAGLSATSAVVNVSVVSPAAVTILSPHIVNNQFLFSYNANPGLSYVVQDSSNLLAWIPLSTNVAASSTVTVTNPVNPSGSAYFRVGRLPNP